MRTAAALLATLAFVAPAAAHTITHGTIHVGRGAEGIELDMTHAQVVAAAGNPLMQNSLGVMSYAPESKGIFDVYPSSSTHRVHLLLIAFPHSAGWHLGNGLPVFTPGAVGKLIDHYGAKLKKRFDQTADARLYYLRGKLKGRLVETQFQVPRFSRRALVEDVYIIFPNEAA